MAPPNIPVVTTDKIAATIPVYSSGTIDSWNPATTRLLGCRAETAMGDTLALLVQPDTPTAHLPGFHRAVAKVHLDSAGAPRQVSAAHTDASAVEVEMTIALRHDTASTPTGAVAALRPTGPRRALLDYAPSGGG